MVGTLCIIMLYTTAMYATFGPDTYKIIFAAFIGILSNVASYFFGKSSSEQPPVTVEKKEEDELVAALKQ